MMRQRRRYENGTTTIAAAGPFDDAVLDGDRELRTCNRAGHRAIAWRDWDGVACPLCGAMGEVNGTLAREHQRALDDRDD